MQNSFYNASDPASPPLPHEPCHLWCPLFIPSCLRVCVCVCAFVQLKDSGRVSCRRVCTVCWNTGLESCATSTASGVDRLAIARRTVLCSCTHIHIGTHTHARTQ